MILEWMMSVGLYFIDVLNAMLGVLPQVPQPVVNALDGVFGIMFSAINLVGIFVDLGMVKILIPLAIAIINADKIIKLVMFILKKIPIIDIK